MSPMPPEGVTFAMPSCGDCDEDEAPHVTQVGHVTRVIFDPRDDDAS
jgi:hypothetical protein